MAYLNFSDIGGSIAFAPIARSAAVPAHVPLDRLERIVVDLSRGDRLSSLKAAGPLGRVIDWVFDRRRVNKLADDRLEALRRFAVLARKGRALDAHEADLVSAGYSPSQAAEVRNLIGAPTGVAPMSATPKVWVGMDPIALATTLWMRSGLENSFLLGVLMTYLNLPIAPAARPHF